MLAIWIEDESGQFVKSLEVMANKRIQYLYTWNKSSAGNKTDAITGETLLSHRTENVTWDGTDTNGGLVADGDYKVFIEYTSAHGQGPLAYYTFAKTAEEVSLQPGNETYFQDLSIHLPQRQTIFPQTKSCRPNRFISFPIHSMVNLRSN